MNNILYTLLFILLSGCSEQKPLIKGIRLDITEQTQDIQKNICNKFPLNKQSLNQSSFKKIIGKNIIETKKECRKDLSEPIYINNNIYFLSNDGKLYGYNIKDNKEVLCTTIYSKNDCKIFGGICSNNKNIFIATSECKLFSIDIKTGSIKWEKKLDTEATRPIYHDGKVFIIDINNQTTVFNAENGNMLWKHSGTINDIKMNGSAGIVIKDNIVISTYSSGEIFALSIKNGDFVWQTSITEENSFKRECPTYHIKSSPVIEKDIVYISNCSNKIVALNLNSGKILWQKPLGSITSPVLYKDYLFTVSNEIIYCLNKYNGDIIYNKNLPCSDKIYNNWMSPFIKNDMLYFVGSNGRIIAMDCDGIIYKIENFSAIVNVLLLNNNIILMNKTGDIIINYI